MNRRHTLLGMSFLIALGSGEMLKANEAFVEEGWQGPAPLQELPSKSLVHESRQACIDGKTGLNPFAAGRNSFQLSDDSNSRVDDEFTSYDVGYYEVELEVYQNASTLEGLTRMHFTCLQDELSTISLHAGSNVSVHDIMLNGNSVGFDREGDILRAVPLTPMEDGETAVLEIDYTSAFSGSGVLSVWRTNVQTGQSVHTMTTQSEPYDARHWWVCKDDTRDKADSTRIAITTNDFNSAVCNGVLESDVDHGDGTRTYSWFERWPMVTYLLSMCVTEYNHIESIWDYGEVSMPMHDWSWGLSVSDQQNVLQTGLFALDALSDRFGMYPFHDEKYGHAQYTWGGAMEHQTCSSMGFYSEAVIAHELGHQWFGDKITCDTFHHIWLNEGWATYSEALYFEHYMGEEALHDYMTYEQYWGGGTIYVENPYTEVIFDGNLSYAKASWVIHMLRHVMGDELFWDAVHEYLGPNEVEFHRTAQTSEFREIMESHYQDTLEWFFEQWIYGEYWPDYQYHWEYNQDSGDLELAIIQAQVPERQLFTMPIDVEIATMTGDPYVIQVWNDQPAQSYTIHVPSQVVQVNLDPKHWILRDTELLQNTPDPNLIVSSISLSDENGDPLTRIPEGDVFSFNFSLSNQGGSVSDIELELSSDHDGVSFSNSPMTIDELGFGQNTTVGFDGETLAGITGVTELTLHISWSEWDLEEQYSFPVGQPDILLVDDDGGDSYESWYLEAAESAGGAVHVTPDELPENLEDYSLIIWFTGDNLRALDESEWTAFDEYTSAGGHTIFTGQHFAEAQGSEALMNHLGLELLSTDHENNAAQGTTGGLFPDELFILFNGGAGNQTSMDVISSVVDCSAPQASYFNHDEGYAAEEFWCGEGRYMVFGFGLEGISPMGSGIHLDETIEALYDWATGGTSVTPETAERPESNLLVTGAWPNPFNPLTVIHFEAPRAGVLAASVYNLAGQRVDILNAGPVQAGKGQISWQPQGLASGLYLLQLELQEQNGRSVVSPAEKLVLLK